MVSRIHFTLFFLLQQTIPFHPIVSLDASRGTRDLEVLFTPYETEARLGVHVAFDVKGGTETLGTAEEDTGLGGGMDFADGLEDHVPVWTTKVCRGAETGDGVLFGVCVIDHDVCCVICFDLCGEVLYRH